MLSINRLSVLNNAIVYGGMRKYHALKFSERKLTLYEEENKNMSNDVSLRVTAQRLGGSSVPWCFRIWERLWAGAF